MKLNLIKSDSTITSGITSLANEGSTIGSVFHYGGLDFVIVSRPPMPTEINALQINPMTLDDSNFTVIS